MNSEPRRAFSRHFHGIFTAFPSCYGILGLRLGGAQGTESPHTKRKGDGDLVVRIIIAHCARRIVSWHVCSALDQALKVSHFRLSPVGRHNLERPIGS